MIKVLNWIGWLVTFGIIVALIHLTMNKEWHHLALFIAFIITLFTGIVSGMVVSVLLEEQERNGGK